MILWLLRGWAFFVRVIDGIPNRRGRLIVNQNFEFIPQTQGQGTH